MPLDYRQFTLFSFILKAYEIIDNAGFDAAYPKNNNWDFIPDKDEYYPRDFVELVTLLEKRGYKKDFDSITFLSRLLMEIDKTIYNFKEYTELFSNNDDSELRNDKYTLIIKPESSISTKLNINHGSNKLDDPTKGTKWLRKKRQFNPNKICYKLGLINLNFVNNNKDFTIKQHFCFSDSLKNDLEANLVRVGFFPFIRMDSNGNPLIKIDKGFATFNINYKDSNGYRDLYLKYLAEAFKTKANIILFPENSIPFNSYIQIGNILESINIDAKKIIVAGTNWNNNTNTCYVFNDTGNLLVRQNKYNPYLLEEKSDDNNLVRFYENLKEERPHIVNLLHIQSFGLIGFPTCSDLVSAKYIESIYCDCEVTDLYIPCMSVSKDIFSSLTYLASHYWISIFACNTYVDKNKIIGFFCAPFKNGHIGKNKNSRSYISRFIKKKRIKNGICVGRNFVINLKKIKGKDIYL